MSRQKGIKMAIDFKNINLEVIDINTNASPDIFINLKGITFSRRVLDDLNYPQNVQYCIDAGNRIFAVRPCKGNEAKATPFAKPRNEQKGATLSCSNRNLHEVLTKMIPDYDKTQRYKVTGELDPENKILYYDMTAAEVSAFRNAQQDDAEI